MTLNSNKADDDDIIVIMRMMMTLAPFLGLWYMTGEGWPPSQHCQGNFFKDHCQDENIKDMIFRYQRISKNIDKYWRSGQEWRWSRWQKVICPSRSPNVQSVILKVDKFSLYVFFLYCIENISWILLCTNEYKFITLFKLTYKDIHKS